MTDDLPTNTRDWDHAAHARRLRERISATKTPPGMPIGDDDTIIRRSLPPYATAGPNPDLRNWLAATTPPGHDDVDRTDPGPFSTDISVGKSSLTYKAHAYPTKVPHEAIMRFLLHYTEPGDVVLDGFCGTGMTGVAAQACGRPDDQTRRTISGELGARAGWGYRRALLADLAPSATRIAAGLNLPIDAAAFDKRSTALLEAFDAQWGWMYETTDDKGRTRTIDYVVWSQVFTCPSCASPVVFYKAAFNPRTGRVAETFPCPTCGAELTKERLQRRLVPTRTLAGDTTDRIDLRPVAIHYRVGKGKQVKDPDQADLAVLRRIASLTLPGAVPTDELPFMHMTHERAPMPAKGFTRVHHFWGDRALVSLSALWAAATAEPDPRLRLALEFWVEQAFWGLSWMNRYKATDHSQVNRAQSGVYYVSSLISECSPRYNLLGSAPARGKQRSLVKMWEQTPAKLGQVAITTGSSTTLDLPDASIDYVFVDPPFGSNIYYADLAYLVESWHGVRTNPGEEAIVNQSKRVARTLGEYGDLMHQCFGEFHRVLKPGRWMTVEFSNSNNAVWLTIQHALAQAGFVVADTRVFDKEQLSYRQVTALTAARRDLIISAYKPADQLELRLGPAAGKPETAWAFVTEHLSHLPVVDREPNGTVRRVRERQPDRLYDRMEMFHLQRNLAIPVSFADFRVGIEDRFPKHDGMHFLDEQVGEYLRAQQEVLELQGAQLFITDQDSAIQWLRQLLEVRETPQPYEAIRPDFFREVQAGLPEWESAPELRVLLQKAFVQDDQGRWYVPDPRKQADLERIRRRDLLKEFAGYRERKGQLRAFSLAAVRAGFSDAWERRDHEAIVDVGRRLPTDAFVQDERLLMYLDNAEQLAA